MAQKIQKKSKNHQKIIFSKIIPDVFTGDKPIETKEPTNTVTSSGSSISGCSSDTESFTDIHAKVHIKDKKPKHLTKKRPRRETEKSMDDKVEVASEEDNGDKNTCPDLKLNSGQDVSMATAKTEENIDSVHEKKAIGSLSVEEDMKTQKSSDKGGHKEPVFEKPRLKKAERIQRDLPKQELEIVDLKKHRLEQLALHEMVTYRLNISRSFDTFLPIGFSKISTYISD